MNPTQICGILTFLMAAIVGCLAARRSPHPIWPVSCGVYLVLIVELLMNLRFQLLQLLRTAAQNQALYETRQNYQPLLIGIVLLVILTTTLWIIQRRLASAPLALCSALSLVGVLGIFLVEIISLHSVDRILYHRIGGVMLIGYFWTLATVPHLLAGLRQATASTNSA